MNKRGTVSQRLIDQCHPLVIGESVIVSPDCRQVAYVARAGKKNYVAVDGQEGTQYRLVSNLVFSPESQRVAYMACEDVKYTRVPTGR